MRSPPGEEEFVQQGKRVGEGCLGRADNNGGEEERGCEPLYISVPSQWLWGRP